MTKEVDIECKYFCEILNRLHGITTVESCCGHSKKPYRVWFRVESLGNLPNLLYWLDGCHCGFYNWRVYVGTDCAKSPVCFCIEGIVGEEAYEQAQKIAETIEKNCWPKEKEE